MTDPILLGFMVGAYIYGVYHLISLRYDVDEIGRMVREIRELAIKQDLK